MNYTNAEIIAVVVLYRCGLLASPTIKSLLHDCICNPESYENFRLIIYDNSEIKQPIDFNFPFSCEVIHDKSNSGLATAYNFALESARTNSINWILFLDQDSSLPENFLRVAKKEIEAISSIENLKVIAPRIEDRGRAISPARDLIGGILRPIKDIEPGKCELKIHAIGSGLIVKTEIFEAIGKFSSIFPMDGLDRWLCHQISAMGWSYLISENKVEHSLSVYDFDKFVSDERYIRILIYEYKFLKIYRGNIDKLIYNLRLFLRAIKYFIYLKNKNFSIITLKHLINKYNDKSNNNCRYNNIQ